MGIETSLRPRGTYSLALTARLAGDATRTFRDGVFDAVVPGAAGPERVQAWQQTDGTIRMRAASLEGVECLRFVLAVDDDHTEFLRLFDDDRLLRTTVRRLRGLREPRVPTVALALLRALCGQLIESKRARQIERRIVRATTEPLGRLHSPPTRRELAAYAPAELRALGLHARRGATLVRVCGALELERLRTRPTEAVASLLERERGLGPWSVGVVCLEGLGRRERGLVGDLGLIKLCSALTGRKAEAADTAELLSRYGEWAGLASVYLKAGFAAGLIPVSSDFRSHSPPAPHRAA